MTPVTRAILSLTFIALAVAALTTVSGAAQPDGAANRTIYVAARDLRGAPVTDLAAADLTLTAKAEQRTIVSLTKAVAPMDVAVIVADNGQGIFQESLADFTDALRTEGRFSIRVLDRTPPKVLDYTNDVNALQFAVGQLGRRQPGAAPGYLNDLINDAAHELTRRHAARPVIVAVSVFNEPVDDRGTDVAAMAGAALAALKKSGASLHVVLDPMRQAGPLMTDGTRLTGGSLENTGRPGLAAVRDTLRSQYALTYRAPDPRKSDTGLVLRTTREGVRLMAPAEAPVPVPAGR